MGLLIGGSVDGLCLCVWLCCGWVVAKVAGFSGFPIGFFFFFFTSVVTLVFIYLFFLNMGFCFGGILVSSGQWWLGFF